MKKSMQRAQLALDKAAEHMAAAKAENRQEFRVKLTALCNEHGLRIEGLGLEETCIIEMGPDDCMTELKLEDVPE